MDEGWVALTTMPDPAKLMLPVRPVTGRDATHTEPLAHVTVPTTMDAPLSFLNVIDGFAKVSATLEYVAGGTLAIAISDVSVRKRARSTTTGAANSGAL